MLVNVQRISTFHIEFILIEIVRIMIIISKYVLAELFQPKISRQVFVLVFMVSLPGMMYAAVSKVEANTFYESDGGLKCLLCPPGKYLERSCEKNFGQSICKSCPEGTFSDRPNKAKSCQDCSPCPIDQVMTKMCRKNKDTRCACPVGTYYEAQGDGLCLSAGMYKALNGLWCQPCPAGSYVSSQCEQNFGSSNCSQCSPGTFSSKPGHATSCQDCSTCSIGQLQTQSCTTTTDTRCECPDGQFWRIQAVEQGVCTSHSVCKPGERILKAGTSLTDTICEVTRKESKEETNLNMVVGRNSHIPNRQTHGSISLSSEVKPLLYSALKSEDFGSKNVIQQNSHTSIIEPKVTKIPGENMETGVTELSTKISTTSSSIFDDDLRQAFTEDSNEQAPQSKFENVSDGSKLSSSGDGEIVKTKVDDVKTSLATKPTTPTLEPGKTKNKSGKRRRIKKGKGLSGRRNKGTRKRRKRIKNTRNKKNGKTKRKKRCRGKERRKKRCRRKMKKKHRKTKKIKRITLENI